MEVSLSLQRAKQASAADQSKFTFIVGKSSKEYSCCLFQACLISQKVCTLVSSDPTCASLRVCQDEDLEDFELLECLWNGERIQLTKDRAANLHKVCKELDNDELSNLIIDFELSSEEISTENVIARLHLKSSFGLKSNDEIEFIASNFFEFAVADLKRMKLSELEMVLSHESLKLDSESSLFDVILELMETDSCYSVLLRYVQFECLDIEHAEKFFKTIFPEFVDSMMWNSMTDYIVKSMNTSPKQAKKPQRYLEKAKEFTYNTSNPMNGIFSYLRQECDGNPHERGVIDITGSSKNHGEKERHQVIDYGPNQYWGANLGEIPRWIRFDFKNSSCCLSGYSIKSGEGYQPKEWVIECSNDGSSWITVDSRNTTELGSNYITKHFSCGQQSIEFFRYIQMKLTGKNCGNDDKLRFSEIEFFGRFKQDKQM